MLKEKEFITDISIDQLSYFFSQDARNCIACKTINYKPYSDFDCDLKCLCYYHFAKGTPCANCGDPTDINQDLVW